MSPPPVSMNLNDPLAVPRKLAGEGAVSLENGETIERVNKRNPCVGMCHRNRAKGRVE